jgi:hypothetical protein
LLYFELSAFEFTIIKNKDNYSVKVKFNFLTNFFLSCKKTKCPRWMKSSQFSRNSYLCSLLADSLFQLITGLVPRIGPGRAVWIALRSRFAFKPVPEYLRFAEIKLLKRRIADKDIGQKSLAKLVLGRPVCSIR